MSRWSDDPRWAAGLAALASLALFAAGWLIPVLGSLAGLIAPLPLLLAYGRGGAAAGRWALALAVGGAILGFQFIATGGGLYYMFYAMLALAVGESMMRGLPADWAVALGGVGGLVCGMIILWGFWGISGLELGPAGQAYWQSELDKVVEAYRQMGMGPEEAERLRRIFQITGRAVLRSALGLLAAGSLLLAWTNLLLARRWSPAWQKGRPLYLWKAPERLVWLLIVAGGLLALGQGFWFWVGANLLVVLSLIYFFQGLAVLAFWLDTKNAPRPLRVVIYLLVALEVFMIVLVALAGLFDLWFNFRRLESKPSA